MNLKREGAFFGIVLEQSARPGESDNPPRHFYEAMRFAAYQELLNVGFDSDAIRRWEKHRIIPSDGLILKKIDSARDDPEILEPLSLDAYRRCFWHLGELQEYLDLIEDYHLAEPPLDQEEVADMFFNIGAHMGLMCHLVGWEKDEEIAVRASKSKAGRANLGSVKSPSTPALRHAISKGYSTGTTAWNYFDGKEELSAIAVKIVKSKDGAGRTATIKFVDCVSGKESRPISKDAMISMVSRHKTPMAKEKT